MSPVSRELTRCCEDSKMVFVIKLVVFLGNPGKEYSRSRHNYARMLLEQLPGSSSIAWRDKFHGRVGDWGVGPEKCRFLAPETFMNVSGKSVAAAVNFHKVITGDLLVIHDDLELPFGQYAWRRGGGLAGHNGLKSIRDSLGTDNFVRLRLGIGRPQRGSVSSWVLGRFSPEDEAVLPLIIDSAATDLESVITGRKAVQDKGEPVRVYSPG